VLPLRIGARAASRPGAVGFGCKALLLMENRPG